MSSKRNGVREKYLAELSEQNKLLYDTADKLVFNFKFFQSGSGYGQSFEEWERETILADLNNKLKIFSDKTKHDLLQDGRLEVYKQYPKGSQFKKPNALKSPLVNWARLRITGRRRLIGFFMEKAANKSENIFYVVFLDKEHRFAPNNL